MIRLFVHTIGWLLWTLLAGIAESLLVLVGLKWRPPIGPARWRWR